MAASTIDIVKERLGPALPELRRRGICHLAIFGSVARADDRSDSDLDLAIEIEPGRAFSVIRLEDTRLLLQDLIGRPVDLGEIDSLRPEVRASFERDKILIF